MIFPDCKSKVFLIAVCTLPVDWSSSFGTVEILSRRGSQEMVQICVSSPLALESARERSSEVKDIIDDREDAWSG